MFAASTSASRALLINSSRRRWPLPRIPHAEPSPSLSNSNAKYCGRNGCSNVPISQHYTFSTIPFDGNAFDSNVSPQSQSEESESSIQKSPTQNVTIATELPEYSASSQKFHRQIQQWISTNPRIAPYKAEESLARLWVEQQGLFLEWEEQKTRVSSGGASVPPPTILLTTEAVNLVLQSWCYSKNGEIAAERAERLLHWMEDLHSSETIAHEFFPKPNFEGL